MRFLDLAVAALIGISAVSALAVWSPAQGDFASQQAALRSGLRAELLSFLQDHGMGWFSSVTPQGFCRAVESSSTPDVTFGGAIGSASCGLVPTSAVAEVSVTFQLPSREVTLAAWSNEGA